MKSAQVTDTGDFGFGWLVNLVKFVPRFLWPTKHQVFGQWFINPVTLAEKTTRWSVAFGSAPGGVADAFVRFSWLAPIVWFLFGVWGGRLRKKALKSRSVLSVGYLMAYLIGLIYWITQDFSGAFAGWLYFVVPLWGASFFSSQRRRASASSLLHPRPQQPAAKGARHAHTYIGSTSK